jgi:hypothetical protein
MSEDKYPRERRREIYDGLRTELQNSVETIVGLEKAIERLNILNDRLRTNRNRYEDLLFRDYTKAELESTNKQFKELSVHLEEKTRREHEIYLIKQELLKCKKELTQRTR